jgi:hypothetical protein
MASGDDPRKDAGYHKQPAIVITPAATVPCGVDVPKKTFEEVYGHDFIAEAESIVPPECDTRSAEQIQKDADERELRRIDG